MYIIPLLKMNPFSAISLQTLQKRSVNQLIVIMVGRKMSCQAGDKKEPNFFVRQVTRGGKIEWRGLKHKPVQLWNKRFSSESFTLQPGALRLKKIQMQQLNGGLNLRFCKRNLNLKVLKFCFENFCYCKLKARFLKTSSFCSWEKIFDCPI